MTNWKKVKLSDVIEIIGGGTPKTSNPEYWGGNIPWLSVVDFGGDRKLVDDTEKKITEKGLRESSTKILKKGQLIISARGTVGELAVLSKDMAFNQSCYGINALRSIATNDFIYYLIKYELESLKSITHGSVFDTITRQTFDQLEINLPNLPTQTRIASILSALDDKIELNRQMNHTLEQMAQALFKKYFVDDIDPENLPDGWRMGKLIDVLELNYGKALKEEERIHGKFPVIGSSGIVGWHNKSLAKGPGVVVGRKGNAGAIIWIRQDFYPIDTTYFVIDKLGVADLFYTHILLQQYDFKNQNADSAVPGLNRNEAYNNGVIVPHTVVVEKFNNLVKPMYGKMMKNSEEIDSLQITRDSILPKLMSGEIEIKEAETILA